MQNRETFDFDCQSKLLFGGDLRGGLVPKRGSGMSVYLRMLRRIDQGEEVEATSGEVGGGASRGL